MEHEIVYKFKRINLRPLENKDIEELRILRNKYAHFFNTSTQISSVQQRKWFKKYLEKNDDIMFSVELVDKPGEFIGAVAIYDIDWKNATAIGGRIMVDKAKIVEKGIGTEIALAQNKIAFEILKLKKMKCSVHKDNDVAIKMDYRVGYRRIGETDKEYLMEITEKEAMSVLNEHDCR